MDAADTDQQVSVRHEDSRHRMIEADRLIGSLFGGTVLEHQEHLGTLGSAAGAEGELGDRSQEVYVA